MYIISLSCLMSYFNVLVNMNVSKFNSCRTSVVGLGFTHPVFLVELSFCLLHFLITAYDLYFFMLCGLRKENINVRGDVFFSFCAFVLVLSFGDHLF